MGLIMEKYLPELISGCFSCSCPGEEEVEEEEGRLFVEVNERSRKKRKEKRLSAEGGWIELAVKRQSEEDRWSVRSHT